MVNATHTSDTQRTTSWFPSLRALWAIAWRLSILLLFVGGVCFCVLTDRWWAALVCVVGFFVASFVIRRVSTVEKKTSSGESLTFL
jgi:TRAP-type C4-dicarboxylate transport system permease large subunit